jgi:hypothetical protein
MFSMPSTCDTPACFVALMTRDTLVYQRNALTSARYASDFQLLIFYIIRFTMHYDDFILLLKCAIVGDIS